MNSKFMWVTRRCDICRKFENPKSMIWDQTVAWICPECMQKLRKSKDEDASPPPITHYDKLISKSREEMAEFIANVVDCCNCKHPRNGCSENDETCAACWLDWLNAEAET